MPSVFELLAAGRDKPGKILTLEGARPEASPDGSKPGVIVGSQGTRPVASSNIEDVPQASELPRPPESPQRPNGSQGATAIAAEASETQPAKWADENGDGLEADADCTNVDVAVKVEGKGPGLLVSELPRPPEATTPDTERGWVWAKGKSQGEVSKATKIEHAQNRIDSLIDDGYDHDAPEFKLAFSDLARLIGDESEVRTLACGYVVRMFQTQVAQAEAEAEDSCAAKEGEGVAAPISVPKGRGKKGKRGRGSQSPNG